MYAVISVECKVQSVEGKGLFATLTKRGTGETENRGKIVCSDTGIASA